MNAATTGATAAAAIIQAANYKGLAFFTKASEELEMPFGVEFILARRIWIPDW